jgi:peroxiredoxin
MMKKMLKVLMISAVVPLLGLAITGCFPGSGIAVGGKAPDFTLTDLAGSSISLRGYIGKPVLINFWKIDCPYCIEEMPYLESVYEDNQDDLVLLTINVADSAGAVKQFLAANGFSLPVLIDSDQQVTQDYAVIGTPTSFFIDRNGIIKDKVVGGFPDKASIESRLDLILPE